MVLVGLTNTFMLLAVTLGARFARPAMVESSLPSSQPP